MKENPGTRAHFLLSWFKSRFGINFEAYREFCCLVTNNVGEVDLTLNYNKMVELMEPKHLEDFLKTLGPWTVINKDAIYKTLERKIDPKKEEKILGEYSDEIGPVIIRLHNAITVRNLETVQVPLTGAVLARQVEEIEQLKKKIRHLETVDHGEKLIMDFELLSDAIEVTNPEDVTGGHYARQEGDNEG